MAATSTIDRLQRHAKRIACGKHERVKPGRPARFTDAASAGDCVRQGDLYLVIVDDVLDGFTAVKNPSDIDRQLVPGNTVGAKHCLDSLDGVTLYRPATWSDESLVGPCFALTKDRTVLHPTHGAVTIPGGYTVQCRYQREWSKEQRRERRARD